VTRALKIILVIYGFIFLLPACETRDKAGQTPHLSAGSSGSVDFPGNMEGARQLLLQFLQPGMDKEALTKKLQPRLEDFQAVFKTEVAAKVEEGYRQPWEEGKIIIHGQPGETDLLLWSATTEELQKQSGEAAAFPLGYTKASAYFKEGLRFYHFKFVRPGEKLGFAWDGLIYVNGRWVIFPQPWRVIPGIVITLPAPEDQ
jgi:hypothetical protein